MWDRKVLEKLEDVVGQFSVSCKFRNIEDNFEWDFSSVYSPIVDREKRLLLEEFAGLYSWWNLPWCVGGAMLFAFLLNIWGLKALISYAQFLKFHIY